MKDRIYDYSGLKPYVPPLSGPEVMLVDLDGTLCLMHGRGPYDEHRVGEDLVNDPVMRTVCALAHTGLGLVLMSGRQETCRPETEGWLAQHLPVPYAALYMRPAGDRRPDWEVKAELFDKHVRDHRRVVMVIDDRKQVVRMWRSIGVTVFQVAEGNF